jgi:hypothetical protein
LIGYGIQLRGLSIVLTERDAEIDTRRTGEIMNTWRNFDWLLLWTLHSLCNILVHSEASRRVEDATIID